MKYEIIILFLFCSFFANATDYYVKPDGGTGDGLTDATAWSYAHFVSRTSSAFASGDRVFIKQGGTYSGRFTAYSNVEYIGNAYGTGDKAVISALTTLSTWTNEGNGIYSAPFSGTNVKSVVFNGAMQPMGRWPDYPTFNMLDSYVAQTSLTDEPLKTSPNWLNAELVFRPHRNEFERTQITGHDQTAGTLSFSAGNGFSGLNGYFVQGALATLTTLGEWYFSSSASKLYVYFGGNSPSSYTVRASTSTVEYGIYSDGTTGTKITGFRVDGGNINGIRINNATNPTVSHCEALYAGEIGIKINNTNGGTVTFCEVRFSNNKGIEFDGNCTNSTISYSTAAQIGMIPGAGVNGAGGHTGIWAYGSNINVYRNRVDSTGVTGIRYEGNNVTIRKNFITNFCWWLDDNGGIYTYHGSSTRSSNGRTGRLIDSNIVIWTERLSTASIRSNSGNPMGALVENIYSDNNTNGITITNNVSAYGVAGIYIHDGYNIKVQNNIVYGSPNAGLKIRDHAGTIMDGLNIQNNIFYSRVSTDYASTVVYPHLDSLYKWGTINNNIYARPSGTTNTVRTQLVNASAINRTIADWYSLSGHDQNSTNAPSGLSTSADSVIFEINPTDEPVTKTAPWYFKDMKGNQYSTTFTVPAWGAVLGVKMATQPTPKKAVRVGGKLIRFGGKILRIGG